mgnify:CR=1 FL=1
MVKDFLPISKKDMKKRGWEQCDFVYVIGDAYVDHSSFGPAIISRLLEANGYSVGIISQPDWKDENSISIFGEPRLGFLVSSGNMDSMVNHYTVSKKHRKTDSFSPGGVMGRRPDYATVVYCNLIRQTFKKEPIIIGGIEASLRRLSHYDYWSDKVKHSILVDSGADLISYGMGEHSIVEIADALNSGMDVHDITYIKGTVYKTKSLDNLYDYVELPDYDTICADKRKYAESFYTQYTNTDPFTAKVLVEKCKEKLYVVQNPPALPLTSQEMDDVYALPYMRDEHPVYKKDGGIPAFGEIKFSISNNRGCFGGCSFCALTFHQGRILQTGRHEADREIGDGNALVPIATYDVLQRRSRIGEHGPYRTILDDILPTTQVSAVDAKVAHIVSACHRVADPLHVGLPMEIAIGPTRARTVAAAQQTNRHNGENREKNRLQSL